MWLVRWATLEDATDIIKDPAGSLNAEGKNKIEDMFDKAVAVGFNVVRMFAHAVKPWHRLQYSPGERWDSGNRPLLSSAFFCSI